jgi:beta-glucanase (GH16 family)
LVATILIANLLMAGPAKAGSPIVGIAVVPGSSGVYWTVTAEGAVKGHYGAAQLGGTEHLDLNKPIVGIASTPDGGGYWLVASDGGIFSYGNARFSGSTGSIVLNKPITGMASTPSGNGYWLVASDGGIFAFGDAAFFGSTGSLSLNKPITGMSTTPDGLGYWLVASDGGIFAFGNAQFLGSTGDIKLNQSITGMATTTDGKGYWLVAKDGGLFAFGNADFLGSAYSTNVQAFGVVPDGAGGYTVLRTDGTVMRFQKKVSATVVPAVDAAGSGQPAGPSGSWTKAFEDEFTGPALDQNKWLTCYPWAPDGCSIGHDEAEWYQKQNVTTNSGELNLTAKKETVQGWGKTWNYTSGMVTTGPDLQRNLPAKYAFKYGYVEARVWLPKGQGLWPAMWLLPEERQWPPEIDAFEVLGHDPTKVYMTTHWGTEANHLQSTDNATVPDLSAGWHTLGVDWQPGSIRWYVDGVERRTPFTNAAAIPDMPMYVIVNLAVGGTWPGYPDASTPFPSTMRVDWLRVWKKQ